MVPAAYLKEQWFDRKRWCSEKCLKIETPLTYFDIYFPNEMSKEAISFFQLTFPVPFILN